MDRSLRAEVAHLLERAGEVALSWFRRAAPERKADGTAVTAADRAVEEVLVEGLARSFPGEGVVSEEGGRVDPRPGAPTWYVDPIDGTSGFVAQLAYWGPTICRVVDGGLQVGGFYVPRLREHWYAEVGGGAWRDEDRLLAPDPGRVGREDLLFVPSRFHLWPPAPWPGKVRALGSGAAHLCHVAAGNGLVAFVPQWSLWDVGCGALLIRESGRVIWDGSGAVVAPEAVSPGLPFLAGAPTALRTLVGEGGWAASVVARRGR